MKYTPDDMIGALHRQTVQLAQYLSQPISEINPGIALEHVVRMHAWLSELNDLYLRSTQANGQGDDTRSSATKQ